MRVRGAEEVVQIQPIMVWVERVEREVLVVVVEVEVERYLGMILLRVVGEWVVVERLEFILFKIFL
jgi:hypothetical protein